MWETRTRQCLAQVHANRDLKVSAVKIVRHLPHLPGLPPFQPFQRLLATGDEMPSVLRCFSGRQLALKQRMAPYTRVEDILEHVHWASGALATKASAASTASASADLGEQLAAARESEARWAKVATELYKLVAE